MKDIIGFEGLYAITSCGKVWSYKHKKFLKGWDNGCGYQVVRLRKNKKNYSKRVHVLVAQAYLEKPNDGQKYEVGHLDDCPSHNWVGNLKWMTHKENLDTDSFRQKQRKKLFTKIRCVETGQIFANQRAASRFCGRNWQGINHVLLGKQKTCGGYHWERVYENKENIEKKKI